MHCARPDTTHPTFDTTAINPAPLILAYSALGRLISPSNDTTTISPNRWGQALLATDPLGHTTTVLRNGVFPIAITSDFTANYVGYTNGLLTSLQRAGHSTAHIRYGAFAQPDSTWGGGSAAQRIFLNSVNGNADSVRHVGPTPNVVRYTYDALGRVLTVRDEAGLNRPGIAGDSQP